MKGSIYLIPVTLGEGDFRNVLTDHSVKIALSLRHFVVEDLRSARRFLRMLDKSFPIDESIFFELNEHTADEEAASFIKPAEEGRSMGLLSEAGLPGIADPGMLLTRTAHSKGIRVIPLSGPSSVMLALAASGLNGQCFTFHGYLPSKAAQRESRIREVDSSARSGYSQIFIETPYRAHAMAESLLKICRPDTMLCIACDITLESESIQTMTISGWRKHLPEIDGRLVVFILGK